MHRTWLMRDNLLVELLLVTYLVILGSSHEVGFTLSTQQKGGLLTFDPIDGNADTFPGRFE